MLAIVSGGRKDPKDDPRAIKRSDFTAYYKKVSVLNHDNFAQQWTKVLNARTGAAALTFVDSTLDLRGVDTRAPTGIVLSLFILDTAPDAMTYEH